MVNLQSGEGDAPGAPGAQSAAATTRSSPHSVKRAGSLSLKASRFAAVSVSALSNRYRRTPSSAVNPRISVRYMVNLSASAFPMRILGMSIRSIAVYAAALMWVKRRCIRLPLGGRLVKSAIVSRYDKNRQKPISGFCLFSFGFYSTRRVEISPSVGVSASNSASV